ncbi:MAG: hypothetical protein F6J94_27550 [Moorea sp. SIO1F2]|uniref:hypothetical protein n=1 Tax=Moorena sp. SIO1F2 TaxID=2607819 RepID=UPI0013BADFB0|nr:hypothetical protein [Moorena sp. SIO1F2]NET85518.1 hypothetical protein [Moorena sp. SIO1F2]
MYLVPYKNVSHLPITPSPHHPISPSPHLPISPSPHLPTPPDSLIKVVHLFASTQDSAGLKRISELP